MSCGKYEKDKNLPPKNEGRFFYARKPARIANKEFISKSTCMSFPLVGNHFYKKDCGQAAMTEIKTECHSTYDSISNFIRNSIDINTFSELEYA